ncbi:MAG: T9SS type A sorting domain-containing protein, partial [Flavobacteriales bacterium]
FESAQEQTMNVRVVNMIGEEVYNEKLENYIGKYQKEVVLKNKSKGIYLLEIDSTNGSIKQKIILQ